MSNEFVPNDPKTFVERGFLTGRPLTIAGVRAGLRPLKNGESVRAGMTFFFTEMGKDGERRVLSGLMHDGAWSDQMKPSDNLKGLVPESGADRPFVEKNSPLGLFNSSLTAAGCPTKLQTGDYSKLIGMVVQLEEKTLPSFKRKKSVDPDEKAAPQKDFKTEVVSKILTLPADNADFVALTSKEITTYLKDQEDKRNARRAAAGAEESEAAATLADDDEEPAPVKKSKKAPVVEEEDDEEDDSPTTPALPTGFSDTDEDDTDEEEEEEAPAPKSKKGPSEAAKTLAAKLILKVMKAEKKVKGSALIQKVHPHLAGQEKKLVAEILPLLTSPPFIASVEGVSVTPKGMVVLD